MLFSHMHNILYFIDIGFQLSNGNSSWFDISSLLQRCIPQLLSKTDLIGSAIVLVT